MPQNPEDLELFRLGKPVRNLAEVIQTGLFKATTMDLFYEGTHLRIERVTFLVYGLDIKPDPGAKNTPLLRRGRFKWKVTNRPLDLHLNLQAQPAAFHDDAGNLMFITLAHTTREGKPAQFVLYRTGRAPKADDLQIIDWPEGLQPELGGRSMRGARN